jgi:hypothetical protein
LLPGEGEARKYPGTENMTRGKKTVVYLLLFVLGLTVTISCSRFLRPSNEEALKAIDDSGLLKGDGFKVLSPLTIVEWGTRTKDGAWPVKVKMTITMRMPNGQMSEPKENTALFRIFKANDSAGHIAWKAAMGS